MNNYQIKNKFITAITTYIIITIALLMLGCPEPVSEEIAPSPPPPAPVINNTQASRANETALGATQVKVVISDVQNIDSLDIQYSVSNIGSNSDEINEKIAILKTQSSSPISISNAETTDKIDSTKVVLDTSTIKIDEVDNKKNLSFILNLPKSSQTYLFQITPYNHGVKGVSAIVAYEAPPFIFIPSIDSSHVFEDVFEGTKIKTTIDLANITSLKLNILSRLNTENPENAKKISPIKVASTPFQLIQNENIKIQNKSDFIEYTDTSDKNNIHITNIAIVDNTQAEITIEDLQASTTYILEIIPYIQNIEGRQERIVFTTNDKITVADVNTIKVTGIKVEPKSTSSIRIEWDNTVNYGKFEKYEYKIKESDSTTWSYFRDGNFAVVNGAQIRASYNQGSPEVAQTGHTVADLTGFKPTVKYDIRITRVNDANTLGEETNYPDKFKMDEADEKKLTGIWTSVLFLLSNYNWGNVIIFDFNGLDTEGDSDGTEVTEFTDLFKRGITATWRYGNKTFKDGGFVVDKNTRYSLNKEVTALMSAIITKKGMINIGSDISPSNSGTSAFAYSKTFITGYNYSPKEATDKIISHSLETDVGRSAYGGLGGFPRYTSFLRDRAGFDRYILYATPNTNGFLRTTGGPIFTTQLNYDNTKPFFIAFRGDGGSTTTIPKVDILFSGWRNGKIADSSKKPTTTIGSASAGTEQNGYFLDTEAIKEGPENTNYNGSSWKANYSALIFIPQRLPHSGSYFSSQTLASFLKAHVEAMHNNQ